MRTDYTWNPPPPPADVKAWLSANVKDCSVDLPGIATRGDCPGFVLRFIRAREEHRVEWKAGAKDRPITREMSRARMRMFNGPWLCQHTKMYLPDAIVYDLADPQGGKNDDGSPMLVRCTAMTWSVFYNLVEAGDEDGARRMAGAIYEWIAQGDARNRVLGELSLALSKGLDS